MYCSSRMASRKLNNVYYSGHTRLSFLQGSEFASMSWWSIQAYPSYQSLTIEDGHFSIFIFTWFDIQNVIKESSCHLEALCLVYFEVSPSSYTDISLKNTHTELNILLFFVLPTLYILPFNKEWMYFQLLKDRECWASLKVKFKDGSYYFMTRCNPLLFYASSWLLKPGMLRAKDITAKSPFAIASRMHRVATKGKFG